MLHRTWLFRVVIIVATTIGASFSSHAFDLLVVGNLSNDVRRFDATTGTFLGTFVSGLPAGPVDIALDPGGETVFMSLNNDTLRSYDLSSGAFLGSMNNSGLSLGFGSDGKLYGADFVADKIVRINPSAGTTEDFVTPGSGGLDGPSGLIFDDGTMYVSSRINGQILRYDAMDGQFEGVLASPGGNGPQRLTVGPDGKLYVPHDDYQTVQRLDTTTGEFDTFAQTAGISDGATPRFGADGNLYVSSMLGRADFIGSIERFDGKTGASLGDIEVGYLTSPTGFIFLPPIPEPETYAMLLAGLGLVGFMARRKKMNCQSQSQRLGLDSRTV